MNINEARGKVVEFISKELGRDARAMKFLKLAKDGENWSSSVEITEQNEYLKKLGYPPVFDKNVYKIELDSVGEVSSFCKKGEEEEEF